MKYWPGKVIYLQDELVTVCGRTMWFSPWTPNLPKWAFQANGVEAAEKFEAIPENLDILVSHVPPHGYGDVCYDWVEGGNAHVGSRELLISILDKKPKLIVCGHIHEGYGSYKYEHGEVFNVSYMDGEYNPVNPPVVIELNE
jgi:hypothetical protein